MAKGWTPERRAAQSIVAKDLAAKGVFGGRGRGQGRPRKIRASEVVAEKVSKEGEAIFDRLMEITRGGKNSDSIAAAKTLLDTEEKERKLVLEEEQSIEDMHRNDLLELVFGLLTEGGIDGIIIEEGEFKPVEQPAIDSASEEPETPSGKE